MELRNLTCCFLLFIFTQFEGGMRSQSMDDLFFPIHSTTADEKKLGASGNPSKKKPSESLVRIERMEHNDNNSSSKYTTTIRSHRGQRLNRTQRLLPLWNFNAGLLTKDAIMKSSTTPVPPFRPEDEVALLFQNSLRISHQVPELIFSPSLKILAQNCSNYHAMRNEDGSTVVPTCPALLSPTGRELAAELFTTPPIRVESRSYRDALWNWYLQIDTFNWATVPVVYESSSRGATQLIWRSTSEFACARSTIPIQNLYVVLCLYAPPGNDPTTFADNVYPGYL